MDLFSEYKSELELVENELTGHLTSDQPDLKEICDYLTQQKGKRFRPLIVILSYRFVGGKNLNDIVPLATAIELIHTATLIHDDINDDSGLRRGYETIYSKYGMSKALIIGDFLFALGFKLGGSYGKNIVDVVADISQKLAEGEFIHLKNSRNPSLTEEMYLDIIERKTAGPIVGGAKIGAMVAEGKDQDIEILGKYGKNIGIAFQIIDDILDITSTSSDMGKPVSIDLKSGKITLPTIQALRELEGESRKRLVDIITNADAAEAEVQEALELIKSTNALSYAKELAGSYVNSALNAISNNESNEVYPALVNLAKYSIERTH